MHGVGRRSITLLPHQGYLVRTQPNSKLQGTCARRLHRRHRQEEASAVIGIQAPFALSTKETPRQRAEVQAAAASSAHVIYEKDKTTYRSEIDQAMKSNPDFLYLNGYAPDTVVVLRDLFKAGIDLPKFAQSYAVPQKTLDANPAEVSDGLFTGQPSADIDGQAYKLASRATRPEGARRLRGAGDRLGEPGDPDHRQGQGGNRHRAQGQRPQDQPGRRAEGLQRRRGAEGCSPRARRSTTRAPPAPATSPTSATSWAAASATWRWSDGKLKFLKIV